MLVLNALLGERGLLAGLRADRHYAELSSSVVDLQMENTRLRSLVDQLRDEPDVIGSIARRELGWFLEGERLFIVK